ncbi:MAG: hypothetical protein E7214_10180 [Clostridium sp.]|nr:hypothetical protein [Clostridium sp.]
MSVSKDKVNEYDLIVNNAGHIKIGEIYNYEMLAKELNIKNTGGNTRKKQMNIIKSLWKLEEVKRGNYLVKEFNGVTDEVKELIKDKRGKTNNTNIYGEEAKRALLFSLLSKANNGYPYCTVEDEKHIIIELPKHNLLCDAGLRNGNNHKIARLTPNYYCEAIGVPFNVYTYLFPRIERAQYEAIKRILEDIEKCGLAEISEVMEIEVVKKYDDDGKYLEEEIFEENLKNEVSEIRRAYLGEVEEINLAKKVVANEMGYKSVVDIYNKYDRSLIQKYYKNVKSYVSDNYGIFNFFTIVKIVLNRIAVEYYLAQFEYVFLEEFKKDAANKFINHRMKKIIELKERINDKHYQEKLKERGKKFYYCIVQLEDDYIENAEKMVRSLCDYESCAIEEVSSDIRSEDKGEISYLVISYSEDEEETYVDKDEIYLDNEDYDVIESLENL